MIVDVSVIRKSSSSLVNDIVFDYKMKRRKGSKEEVKTFIPFVFLGLGTLGPGINGIYSYEMMNVATTSGDVINGVIFGSLPVLQGLSVSNIKMFNTYLRAKLY